MATILDLRALINELTELDKNAPLDLYQKKIDEIIKLRDLWEVLPAYEYSNIMLSVVSIYRQFQLYQEALEFLNKEYGIYDRICGFEYVSKSRLHELWADLLLLVGHTDSEILKELELSVYYIFIDNTTYNEFEFFSFRSFPEDGTPVEKQYSLNDIRNNTLSFSSPSRFNDPMDTILFRWNAYRKSIAQTEGERHLYDLYEQAIKPLKARCFARHDKLPRAESPLQTMNPETIIKAQHIEDINPLMWAHYTDSHKGFCVKYSFPSSFVMNNDHNHLTFTRIGNADYQRSLDFTQRNDLSVMDALFMKDEVWSYETEVRIVHYDPSVTDDFKLLNVPENSIREIYLGMKCTENNCQLMRDAIAGRNIPLYKMTTKDSDVYHLVAERIG